jgi:hypothetical protein
VPERVEVIARPAKISRIWLVSGLRQLVRSEASWALCNLIRASPGEGRGSRPAQGK